MKEKLQIGKIGRKAVTGILVTGVLAASVGLAGGCAGETRHHGNHNDHNTIIVITPPDKPDKPESTPDNNTDCATDNATAFTFRHFEKGQCAVAGPNDYTIGDVVISDNTISKTICDKDPDTRLVVDIQKSGVSVTFPWGGDLRTVTDPAAKFKAVAEAVREQRSLPETTEVSLIVFTGGKDQATQG